MTQTDAVPAPDTTDRNAWIQEGAFPVAPGVHRIPLPLPSDALRAVNVYAIETGDGLVLIDSGWALADALDQLKRQLAVIGAGLGDVRQFLVTHMHRDHYTQAVAIRRLLGTKVAIGADERPTLEALVSGQARPMEAQLAILSIAGAQPVIDQLESAIAQVARATGTTPQEAARRAAANGYELPDQWISPDEEFGVGTRTLTAIATPGHTRGHVVFADAAAGLLFAGDHVLPHITPSLGFQQKPSPQPLQDYLHSLAVIRRLPDMRLLPAHGPVTDSTHARVDELAAHHAQRLDIMADVLSAGPTTGYDVAAAVRWTGRRQRPLTELDPMNQMLAVCETIYHLEVLVAQGRAVSHTGEDGVRQYQLAAREKETSA